MNEEEFEKELDALSHEIMYVLLFLRTFLRHQFRFVYYVRNGSNSDFSDTWVSLKCIESDLTFRLIKLDEDKKGYHTIHSVWRLYDKKERDQKKKKKVRDKMKEYRHKINHLKIRKRNIILGHLKKGERDDLNVSLNFNSQVSILKEIMDLFNGNPMTYFWKEGGVKKNLIEEINSVSEYLSRAKKDKSLYEKKVWENW